MREPIASNNGSVLSLPPIDQQASSLVETLTRRVVRLTLGTFGACLALTTITLSTVSIAATADGTGSLEPVRAWPLRSFENGNVSKVFVRTGDTVRQGQLLVRLDSLQLSGELREAQAQFAQQTLERDKLVASSPVQPNSQAEVRALADAHLLKARATLLGKMTEYSLGRNVDSLLEHYVPGDHVSVDLATADVRIAESELRSAETGRQLEDLRPYDIRKQETEVARLGLAIGTRVAHLRRLELRAPANGVVVTEQVEQLTGTVVRAGEQVLEVADLSDWRANMLVTEGDVQQITVGDSATVDVPALKRAYVGLLRGVVTSVALEATVGARFETGAPRQAFPSGTPSTYRVQIRIDGAQLRSIGAEFLRTGYTATANVIFKREPIIRFLRELLFRRLPTS